MQKYPMTFCRRPTTCSGYISIYSGF